MSEPKVPTKTPRLSSVLVFLVPLSHVPQAIRVATHGSKALLPNLQLLIC